MTGRSFLYSLLSIGVNIGGVFMSSQKGHRHNISNTFGCCNYIQKLLQCLPGILSSGCNDIARWRGRGERGRRLPRTPQTAVEALTSCNYKAIPTPRGTAADRTKEIGSVDNLTFDPVNEPENSYTCNGKGQLPRNFHFLWCCEREVCNVSTCTQEFDDKNSLVYKKHFPGTK